MEDKLDTRHLVSFRAGPVAGALAERAGRQPVGGVGRRDLERYYALLAQSLRRVDLTEAEALAICDALNGTIADSLTVHLLWAVIDDAVRLHGLADRWAIDGSALVAKVRGWSLAETLAVIDAVERWLLLDGKDRVERLRRVGLIRVRAVA